MDDHLKQLLLLGREHYQKREYDKAEYLLRQVVAQTDKFADVHHMLGVILHSRGDFQQAEQYFEKAVELNPNYTEAQLNLMVTYNDLGKYDKARTLYASMRSRSQGADRQLDPFAKGKIANMHAELSNAYQDVGMIPEAILELEKAVHLCPTFADLRTRLGVLLKDSGDLARAREHFETAKQINPKYLQARVQLGVLALSAGESARAAEEFRAVLAEDPDNKSAQTYPAHRRAAQRAATAAERERAAAQIVTLSEQGAARAPARRRGFLRRLWRQLRGGETSRGRASASVAVGLFIGCLPLYGLHLPLCLAVCLPLRLDSVTAYIAANISNPLVAPFLFAAEIQVGSYLTRGSWTDLDVDSLDAARMSGLALELALGSLVIGTTLSALGALVSWTLFGRVQGEKTELDQAIARTIARYEAAARGDRYYVASKLHADPVLEQIAAQPGSFGRVVDAACGRGQLGLCLLELGRVTALHGFDSDRRKVDAALAAAGADAQFELADLRSAELPIADTLLLIDVLHYLSPADQRALLERAARALSPDGRLFVRELDAGRGWRAFPAMLAERIARLTRYNAGPTLAFSKTSELIAILEANGLTTELDTSGGLSNVLIIARRAELTAS